MNEIEEKLRKLITAIEEPLRFTRLHLWNDECLEDPLYIKTIQSCSLIDELKKLLEKKDPRSSKRFTQKKIEFK